MLGQRVAAMRRCRSAITSPGISTRKGRISVSLDMSLTSLDWLTTTDGRTGRLRPDVPGQRPIPAPAELALPHDCRPGGRAAPVTSLVCTLACAGPRQGG